MRTYAAVFLLAFMIAVFLTPLVIVAARRLGVVDRPGRRRVHRGEIPRVGGIAIVLPVLVATAMVFLLRNKVGFEFRGVRREILGILGGGIFLFAVGLLDDVLGLRPRVKFAAEFAAALFAMWAGIVIGPVGLTETWILHLGPWAWPLTFLWIVGVTNAVNLIDGLDGLAGGIAAITCAILAGFAVYLRDPVMGVLMLSLLGGLLGFLVFNFNPARIFMGDCGSLFVGYVLATSSVLTGHKTTTMVGLALPMLALGVPIFDTLLSMTRRLVRGRSPFQADRGHVHHRLLARGLDQRIAVLLLYGVTFLAALIGSIMIVVRNEAAIIVFVFALAFLVLFFWMTGVLQVSRTMRLVRERFFPGNGGESSSLSMEDRACLEAAWDRLIPLLESSGVLRAELSSGSSHRDWRAPGLLATRLRWKARLPLTVFRHGIPGYLEFQMPAATTTEEFTAVISILAETLRQELELCTGDLPGGARPEHDGLDPAPGRPSSPPSSPGP